MKNLQALILSKTHAKHVHSVLKKGNTQRTPVLSLVGLDLIYFIAACMVLF